MKYSTLLFTAAALGLLPAISAQITISAPGIYTQNFDTLPLSGTSNTWTDNSTLAGWYADRETGGEVTVISAGTGSSTTTNLYSFGSTSTAERALGALGSGSSGAFAYGVAFQNVSAQTITFTDFSYRGELWRMGSPAEAETLQFAYRISSSPIAGALTGIWTDFNPLDFTNPNPAAPSGGTGAMDGNLSGNFTNLSATLNVSLTSGSYVMFRWYDIDHSSADNGLGIDNISIAYVANAPVSVIAAVPEPSAYGIVAATMLVAVAAWRRRRSA
jgi:uncharacterized protein